jgi:hypothetical protein
MKKILFNDKYELAQAVLDGRKTMTRRAITCPRTFRGEWVAGFNVHIQQSDRKIVDYPCMYDADEREFDGGQILPKYKVGEVVAIAQCYRDIDQLHRNGKNAAYLELLPGLKLYPGWGNKMFVRSDLMLHHIRITDIKVERLKGISDTDCLREGIVKGQCGSKETHLSSVDTNICTWETEYSVDYLKNGKTWTMIGVPARAIDLA